jgi:hypothetical protein
MATIKKSAKRGGKKGGSKRGKKSAKRGAKRSSTKHVKPFRVGEVFTKKLSKAEQKKRLPLFTYCGVDGTDHKTGKKLHIVKRYTGKTLKRMQDAHKRRVDAEIQKKADKRAKAEKAKAEKAEKRRAKKAGLPFQGLSAAEQRRIEEQSMRMELEAAGKQFGPSQESMAAAGY